MCEGSVYSGIGNDIISQNQRINISLQDPKAAGRFLREAIGQNGTPEKITIDKSSANTTAMESYNKDHEAGIEIRQVNTSATSLNRIIKPSNDWCGQCWGSNRTDQLT
jgi:transposase-like protein